MVIHNQRSVKQWEIISSHVDFKGKGVIDLGCGWCDLLRFARDGGASTLVGVDKAIQGSPLPKISNIITDLDNWVNLLPHANSFYDIALCFSVLPYLKHPTEILEWMREYARVSFVECQYAGDGPGFTDITSDYSMRVWLSDYWSSVKPIGYTVVKDRNKKRTIWMCE